MFATIRSFALLSFLFLFAGVSGAQEAGSINGRVLDDKGNPVTDAQVSVLETRSSSKVDGSGAFSFSGLAAGHYHVVAESRRAGTAVGEVELAAGGTGTVQIVLDPAVHSEE